MTYLTMNLLNAQMLCNNNLRCYPKYECQSERLRRLLFHQQSAESMTLFIADILVLTECS